MIATIKAAGQRRDPRPKIEEGGRQRQVARQRQASGVLDSQAGDDAHHDEPVEITDLSPDRSVVRIGQVVRALDGTKISEGSFDGLYRFLGGLIQRMDVLSVGRSAIRAYWTEQWSEINPHVEPVTFHPEDVGYVLVEVHQVVRDLVGTVVADEHVGIVSPLNTV